MFNQQEVQILIGGVNAPIDLDDLRRNTNYGGLYDDNHETVVMFWNVSRIFVLLLAFSTILINVLPTQVVNSFDQEQRRALLRFVTSCSRPPLLYVSFLSFVFSSYCSSSFFHLVVDSKSSCRISPSATLARISIASLHRVHV